MTIKGPGEFPTGKTITFAPGTDIDLIEGCAAIEMRSYYAGESVITASSPGLKDAALKILIQGGPAYNPATSVEAVDRPYKRFTQKDWETLCQPRKDAGHDDEIANLATNRPSKASSNNEDRALASDGDKATAWKAAAGDPAPEWVLDMEFEFNLLKVALDFPDGQERGVAVFVSADGKEWKPLGRKLQAKEKSALVNSPAAVKGRYVKVAFDKAGNAAISEIAVTER